MVTFVFVTFARGEREREKVWSEIARGKGVMAALSVRTNEYTWVALRRRYIYRMVFLYIDECRFCIIARLRDRGLKLKAVCFNCYDTILQNQEMYFYILDELY